MRSTRETANFFVAATVACATFGCSSDLAVPSEAKIGCRSEADCPSGWTCNEKVGRCVKTENIDSTVPALAGEVSVSSPTLKRGATARVTFEVSEDLSKTPVVSVSAGTDRLLSLDDKASSGTRYVFAYQAVGDEPQGVESPISIVLTDKSGNESGKLSGKSLRFDFLAPDLVDATIAGSPVNKKGAVTVTFSVNETPAEAPVVKLATGQVLAASGEPKNNKYTYSYAPTGDESEDPAGVSVTVDLVDGARNEKSGIGIGTIVFDFAAPAINGSPAVTPAVAKAGTTVTVAFETTEPLSAMPVVKAGGKDLAGTEFPGNSYQFGYKVAEGEADGERAITISLSDRAGNPLDDAAGGSFVVDSTTPQLGELVTSSKKYSARPGFNTVTLTFDCSEDVEGGLVATVGEAFMKCEPWRAASPNYTCTYPVTGEEVAGTTEAAVAAIDKAGNIGFRTTSIDLDFSGPGLTLSVQPNNRPARLGEIVTIGVASSEALNPVGVALDSGGLALGAPSGSGTSFTWTYSVKATDEGSFNLSAAATDTVGNPAAAPATGTVALDGVKPSVSNVAADKAKYSRAAGHDRVTVSFHATENVGTGLAVAVGGQSMTCGAPTGTPPDLVYACACDVQAGDTDGIKEIAIQAPDAAGNTAFGSGSVEYDFTPPVVTSSGGSPDPAGLGRVLVYTLNASEPLLSDPILHTVPDLAFTGPSRSGTAYTWTRTVDGSEGQGVYTATLDMADAAGNTSTGLAVAGFKIDNAVPSITAGPEMNKSPAYYRAGDVVSVTFTTSEDLGAALPAVKLNTNPPVSMPCTSGGANAYTCAIASPLLGTESPQGGTGISIALSDAAGNSSFASPSVTLDFTRPQLLTSTPSKTTFKLGDKVFYTVNVTEALMGTPGRPVPHVSRNGVEQAGFFGPPTAETDTSFTYSTDVMSNVNETYTVTIDLTDLAGNVESGVPATGWLVDPVSPIVTPVDVTTNNPNDNRLAKVGDVVTAVFTVDEPLPADPSVVLGSLAMRPLSKTGTGPYTYTFYSRPVETWDGEGLESVMVTATDAAGNVAAKNIGGVTYDFTAPAVTAGSETVQLIPFAGCLLPAVTKVAMNTTARVSFNVNEALLNDPGVTIDPLAGTWTIAKLAAVGLSYSYDIKPTGGSPTQGATSVRVVLTDRVGNVSAPITLNLPSPGIEVDTDAPMPIGAAQNDLIAYKRIPWGSDATAGIKKFSIKTEPACGPGTGAVEPDSTVIFWDAADTATGSDIGRATPDANGCFAEKELNRADRAHVFLSQVDKAGNIDSATATEIKNHEWTATMGYKVPGSTLENPHRYETLRWFTANLKQEGSAEAGESDGLGAIGIQALDLKGAGAWRRRTFDDPSARQSSALAYDAARGKVVLFGGYTGNPSGETWEWDGTNWVRKIPADPEGDGNPSARYGHAMAYDSARGKTVLFGGGTGEPAYETWEWDGTSWEKKTPADPEGDGNPSPRGNHAMVYDSARGKTVLFGGYMSGFLDDTWEWDGTSWAMKSPADPEGDGNPSARYGHAMAYDIARGKTILFGGLTDTLNGETWEWDGASWVKKTPADPEGDGNPSARKYHTLAYDTARGRTILFGGDTGALNGETWEWNGISWAKKSPADPEGDGNPSARYAHALAYDGGRGKTVVFGGNTGSQNGETWEWEGTSWTRRTPADPGGDGNPSPRNTHAMAYDSARGRTVLFGGGGFTPNDETWELDGTSWVKKTPADPEGDGNPSGRSDHAMAYDSVRGKTVLFGGFLPGSNDETWEWDGTSWAKKTPADPEGDGNPSARFGHALAYDSTRGRTVLFGGFAGGYNGETWEWDGASWAKKTPADPEGDGNPSARYNHAMAYDGARGRTILFGGWTGPMASGETWEWDGTSWAQKAYVDPEGDGTPWGRDGHSLAYDGARGRTVLFGGYADGYISETWEWDGTSWAQKMPTGDPEGDGNPSARRDQAMAYDGARGKTVLFGGEDPSWNGETWEWDVGANARPGQLMETPFVVSGVSAAPTWKSVAATFYSGAVGFPGGVATNGVDLKVWDEGMWKAVATNNAPPGTPQLVTWTTTDPLVISRLFFGNQQALNFAVTPVAPNGTGVGEVSVDYAEVVVRYKLP
ncbi:MAG: hypothetical protein HY897_07480 [Deltaproteobacteria bacterium]|nr:hypothetical protein [Deltaproteobacteria bacterium]